MMTEKQKSLGVGDPLPDITLDDQNGQAVRLRNLAHGKPLVVFFYPKDGTPVCTAEACAFRDAYDRFAEMGAEVVGISCDSVDRHSRFAQKHRLNFRVLSDPQGDARRAFGVPKTLGAMPGRVTYTIDGSGTIRHVFSSQLAAGRHVDEALKGLGIEADAD